MGHHHRLRLVTINIQLSKAMVTASMEHSIRLLYIIRSNSNHATIAVTRAVLPGVGIDTSWLNCPVCMKVVRRGGMGLNSGEIKKRIDGNLSSRSRRFLRRIIMAKYWADFVSVQRVNE